jgi:phosphoglycolate phosphatase-like HAD superfamily hydrolase
LKTLGVAADRAIMVGDTFNDLEAGRKAGTYIGAVLWGFGEKEILYTYKPEFIFKEVSELNVLSQLTKESIQLN